MESTTGEIYCIRSSVTCQLCFERTDEDIRIVCDSRTSLYLAWRSCFIIIKLLVHFTIENPAILVRFLVDQ
jgi:hypothetical protein